MGNEAGKAYPRLKGLMSGKGIDIGCGSSPIGGAEAWDLAQGDAQYMVGVPDDTYDWVFSSHCLEHLKDPHVAIQNWWRILKIGGYLIVLVPDEDLYEQRAWPSRFNSDHKRTFTLSKDNSWSPVSVNCADLLRFLPGHRLISLTLEDNGYDYEKLGQDQTGGSAEASVQFIVRKEVKPEFGQVSDLKIEKVTFVSS